MPPIGRRSRLANCKTHRCNLLQLLDHNLPTGLVEARKRLLKTNADAWSTEDRRQVGEFLQARIQVERSRDEQATLLESLSRALDYRRWHRFRVQRQQDRQWRE